MPSLETSRRIFSQKYNGAKTVGQIHKENSNFIIEQTWDNDIQSKICYIYDHIHDDQPELKDHMTYENTTKTKIDAKFIISSYGSIDKDQVAYHIMFKPSQSIEFQENDELYYYETDYRKRYVMRFPVGMFIDIPDENGIYAKWLIVDYEESNQFMKYSVLPCDYRLQWISIEGNNRVKRQMWCCTRSLNSYNSGLWVDRYIYALDDLNKIFLPLNSITENISYLNEDGDNQRLILSAKVPKPLTWKVSKFENTKPIGIIRLSLKQDQFNPNTDYIERDANGNIIGMYADYYKSEVEPIEPIDIIPTQNNICCILTSSTANIKVGGSYKLITANIMDTNNNNFDITNNYSTSTFDWSCSIDGVDCTSNGIVSWLPQSDFNKMKVKFSNNKSYLNKILLIKCTIDNVIIGEIQLLISN